MKISSKIGHFIKKRAVFLETLVNAFEKAADRIKRNSKYKVWQDGNPASPAGGHPILLVTNKMLDQRLHYLHDNPVEAGIVEEPEYYLFCSARNYAGMKGLLEVEFVE